MFGKQSTLNTFKQQLPSRLGRRASLGCLASSSALRRRLSPATGASNMRLVESKAETLLAPKRFPSSLSGRKSVFLAGTTTSTPGVPDWRTTLSSSISELPIAIFNPLRPDWDSSWREDASFPPFREQVEWELEMRDRADVVIVWFGAGTDAPISLLEFGLSVGTASGPGSGKTVIVGCDKGYRRRGNVQILCEKYGILMVDQVESLGRALKRKLAAIGVNSGS